MNFHEGLKRATLGATLEGKGKSRKKEKTKEQEENGYRIVGIFFFYFSYNSSNYKKQMFVAHMAAGATSLWCIKIFFSQKSRKQVATRELACNSTDEINSRAPADQLCQ